MNVQHVIESFSAPERLPVDAIRSCLSSTEESVPAFLAHLRHCADNDVGRDEADSIFLIAHMLAELREQRAFRPLMDFLTGDQMRVERVFGDAITETLSQVLIGLYDGDRERLYDAMNTPSIDVFLRGAVFGAWTYFVANGAIDRDEAREYLRNCVGTLRPRGDSNIWVSWTDAIAHLGFHELTPLVREAFDDGRVNEGITEFRYFEKDLAGALGSDSFVAFLEKNRIHPFDDTIGVLSTWHCFSEEFIRRQQSVRVAPRPNEMLLNPNKTVGRNDPCPCGSGKKYKKCCLN